MNKVIPSDADLRKNIEEGKNPLWYKDAIIYQVHVKSFFDSNNDGIGDFAGLAAKLDYLQDLGVTAIWLLPFYPSPQRDDGYDISDYRNVNPAYGTLSDFQLFVEEAHKRGLRVITELVINHTSDQHPWFQKARLAPLGSKERDFYMWSDTDQKYKGTRIIFSDTETSNWQWDPVAKAYYWHRFFSHQPDLNFESEDVLNNVIEIMYFWLDMGVDGLRLDAIPYLCAREGTSSENLPETHEVLKKIRAAMDARYPDRMLLAEANQWPEDVLAYFGEADECHMAFHFPLMPRIYMAVAQEDRHPITDIMFQTPVIPPSCQWAVFLRNHDELTLEMVTDRERDYLWNFYAADKRARINFGIRRRLAPLMENDRRKIELLNSLLFSMPGTPIIYYGDELGMGDNIYLGDRNGVRTPMQWSPDRNGGFSRSDPERLFLAAVMDPIYGYQTVNVETQKRVLYSLLNWMRNLISIVKAAGIFGRGTIRFLSPTNRTVLAYLREYNGSVILCTANLSRSPQAVELDLREFNGLVPLEMLGQSRFPAIGELPYLLTLSPYGFYWFKLTQPGDKVAAVIEPPELSTLVLPANWDRLFNKAALTNLRDNLLPTFLMTRRWYKAKHTSLPKIEFLEVLELGEDYRIIVMRATPPDTAPQTYVMGLGVSWDDGADDPLLRFRKDAICKVRRFNRVGILYEATRDDQFLTHIVAGFAGSTPSFTVSDKLAYAMAVPMPDLASLPIKSLGAEQTNSSASVGEKYIIKFVHQPPLGPSLEEEFGRHLTEIAQFNRAPKLTGTLALKSNEGPMTIGLVEEMIVNQGDGWTVTLAYLARMIKGVELVPESKADVSSEDNYYALLAKRLGTRTAELHTALSLKTGDVNFDSEPVSSADRERWIDHALIMLDRAHANIEKIYSKLSEDVRVKATLFKERRDDYANLLRTVLPNDLRAEKIRVHGDYHLGQVLVADNDFYIIDFEGEPARAMDERRQKTSPLKDVASMVRSFDYAAASALKEIDITLEKNRANITTLVQEWARKAEQSFLNGYWETAPSGKSQVSAAMLLFFELEKALYEIVYESQHRPTWMEIPLTTALKYLEEAKQ